MYLIGTLGMIVLISSMTMSSNFIEHIDVGLKIVPLYLHLPLQIGIPVILLIVTLIRNRLGKRAKK